MKRMLAAVAFLLAAALVACSGPAGTDPYQLTRNALDRPYERVQLNIGFSASGEDQSIDISPEMIRLVIDTASERGLLTVRAPIEALGLTANDLGALGLIATQIELDVLFDSEALYARMPMAAPFLALMVGQVGEPIEGDFGGWLRLGTRADLDALGEMASAMAPGTTTTAPDFLRLAGLSPGELQEKLESSGVTLSFEGSVTRDGRLVDHVSLAIDYARFAANPLFEGFEGRPLDAVGAGEGTLSADVWFDRSSGRPAEIVIRGSATEPEKQSFELTVKVSEPDPTISLDAPESFFDLPLLELYGMFLPALPVP